MQFKKIGYIFLVLVLLVGNIIFITKYTAGKRQLKDAEQALQTRVYNGKVISFISIFVEKVLRADHEISFEDRFQLENAVRDLKDDAVIGAWNTFVKSNTEEEAQAAVKDLLSILVSKIRG